MSNKKLEILAMDSTNSCVIQNIAQLSHSLMSNSKISDVPELNAAKDEVSFKSVKIKSQLIKPDNGAEQGYKLAFLVKMTGNFDDLEPVSIMDPNF